MKNFDFQIADRAPLYDHVDHECRNTTDEDDSYISDFINATDAYSLEDLLRLVQIGDDSCIDRDNIEFLSDEDALIWGLSYLTETQIGRSMAFDARFEEWSLEVDDIPDNIPEINSQLRILIMPRGTPSLRALSQTSHYRYQFLMNLARGLRMIWQDMNGAGARIDISIDDQILFERLRAADMDVVMLRMAWELREIDNGALWRQLITEDIGELVTSAAGIWADDNPRRENLPNSLLQIFQLWLASDNLINQVDARTLDIIDERLGRGITNVCGTQLLRHYDILALSRLPDLGAYLAPISRSIIYAEDMRRMPNQTTESHLRQIIEDCGYIFAPPLIFNDTSLQEKIFPTNRIDTIV